MQFALEIFVLFWKINPMCLAIPAKVVQLLDHDRAMIDVGGIRREISVSLVPDVKEDDYVIVHVGYAISRLDETEAQKTLQLFQEMSNEIY